LLETHWASSSPFDIPAAANTSSKAEFLLRASNALLHYGELPISAMFPIWSVICLVVGMQVFLSSYSFAVDLSGGTITS